MSSPAPSAGKADHIDLVRRPAPAGLESFVTEIVCYREHGCRPARQVEPASLVVPLIVGFEAPFEIALRREPAPDDRIGSFAAGLCAAPALINSPGTAHCMQVNFTPLGARRFFGLPMSELADRMVALDDLGDAPLRALRQRLGEEEDWNARFALMESHLRTRLLGGRPASAGTAWAYERIVATGGRAGIAQLADRLDWSRKHLAQRFRAEIGLAPKAVARITRFTRAQALARRGGDGWADIAVACGYADQAHLIREFREFAGATPMEWLGATA